MIYQYTYDNELETRTCDAELELHSSNGCPKVQLNSKYMQNKSVNIYFKDRGELRKFAENILKSLSQPIIPLID
jgi:hypothetical protein